ncbi:efflux RND transporter permease subunit [Nevskia soli]|uniref:efflux RND transporter permease subunit n=1 Tax=Nevskia soli TaxID=418856 RepID=UPI0004A74333|nr:CusA/CzcA family heavy metal efflux RND transporter [Nevskia soli]
MIDRLIDFAIRQRWLVMALVAGFVVFGVFEYKRLPIDAVPDITNVQVQINTRAPGYSPLEVEQRVTFLVETAMAGIPKLESTRSISVYGLSQVTVVFKDGTDIYFARQLVNERLQDVKSELPDGTLPEMGPVATGLGEIFLYTISAEPGARKPDGSPYTPIDLHAAQDWIIKPQLRQVPGVSEVNSIGGFDKQYQVAPDPARLLAYGVTLRDLIQALQANNVNVGAGYIERNGEQSLVRVPGQLSDLKAIGEVVITTRNGIPVRVGDVAEVGIGKDLRTGAATLDGAETVLGTAMMLIGENSRTVSLRVADKLAQVARRLPPGIKVEAVYDRTVLVNQTIATVQKNLAEGALLVIVVLFLFLGNLRAALLTAMVIPLALLATFTGMVENRVSGNLMSLGALDFGLIVDGALIIVENCVLRLAQAQHRKGRTLERNERFEVVGQATREVFKPSLVSVAVIVLVNLPIFALGGVEGKMFHPMAFAVIAALIGALVFSLTFVPAACALLLTGNIAEKDNGLVRAAKRGYAPLLRGALRARWPVVAGAVAFVVLCGWSASRMGAEFIPQLDEGDIAIGATRPPGTGIEQAVSMQKHLNLAIKALPEVDFIFARNGTADVATDPMSPGRSDVFVRFKPRAQWPDPGKAKATLIEEVETAAQSVPGTAFEFSQPIQMRMNELISGVRSDVAVKVFGDDFGELLRVSEEVRRVLARVPGAEAPKVEQVSGLPLVTVESRRTALARYGLTVADVQDAVSVTLGGKETGLIYEGDARYPLEVRLAERLRTDPEVLARLPLAREAGGYVPLAEVADIKSTEGPNQISRDNGKRRIVVMTNVRGRDLAGFVAEARNKIEREVKLPPGYYIEYGGTFEQLASASKRLTVLVPLALALIFGLLFMTFGSVKDAVLVFSGVPLALTGGVLALLLRGIPLSITAGVGFITLSGVAVLTGVVMVSAIRDLMRDGTPLEQAIVDGALLRLRPILMIGLVASLGFLPMALNTGTGAEVQRPLATVVIGGIISATLLTLLVLPALYRLAHAPGRTEPPI